MKGGQLEKRGGTEAESSPGNQKDLCSNPSVSKDNSLLAGQSGP